MSKNGGGDGSGVVGDGASDADAIGRKGVNPPAAGGGEEGMQPRIQTGGILHDAVGHRLKNLNIRSDGDTAVVGKQGQLWFRDLIITPDCGPGLGCRRKCHRYPHRVRQKQKRLQEIIDVAPEILVGVRGVAQHLTVSGLRGSEDPLPFPSGVGGDGPKYPAAHGTNGLIIPFIRMISGIGRRRRRPVKLISGRLGASLLSPVLRRGGEVKGDDVVEPQG